jgi:hypothetical protein
MATLAGHISDPSWNTLDQFWSDCGQQYPQHTFQQPLLSGPDSLSSAPDSFELQDLLGQVSSQPSQTPNMLVASQLSASLIAQQAKTQLHDISTELMSGLANINNLPMAQPVGLSPEPEVPSTPSPTAGPRRKKPVKRTQNKAAADKYRRKKKEHLETLQGEVDVYSKKNLQLEQRAKQLDDERSFLVNIVTQLMANRADKMSFLLEMSEDILTDEMIPGSMTKEEFVAKRPEWKQIMQDTSRKIECRLAEISMAIEKSS